MDQRSQAAEPVLARLQLRLRKEMNELADQLANGVAQSFDQYQHMVGKIHGLGFAERELLDIDIELVKQDDNDA